MVEQKCFVCKKEIECALVSSPSDKYNDIWKTPNDSITFISYSYYGSSICNPGNNENIQIIICDDCLKKDSNLLRYIRIIMREEIEEIDGEKNGN